MERLKEIFAYFVAAMAMLALLCAVYEAMNQRLKSAGVLGSLFVACAFILYLPQLDTFKAFGIEAKMQNTLDRVEVTLQQLQKMAAAFAKANLAQIAMSGQISSGIETRYKFEMHDQIINNLRGIHVSDADISDAQGLWIQVYCTMLLNSIEREVIQLLQNTEIVAEIGRLPKIPNHDLPSPDAVRNLLTAKSLTNERLTKLMDAYASVWTTGSMPDPSLIPFNQVLRSRPNQ